MPITIQCPNPVCQQTVSVSDALSGRSVKCRKCGTAFVATPTLDHRRSDTRPSSTAAGGGAFAALPADFGRYRVLQLLGKGGMGAVYLAVDSQLNRRVALKVPFFNAREEPRRAERFIREARSAACLHHPNICTVFDAGEIDNRPFITMALIDGQPLDDLFSETQLLPVPTVLTIVRQVAVALQKAHDQSIVHRDLKPANIMITPDGEPIIMDFGLAKLVGEADAAETRLTQEGALLGTPRYMAPEQVHADQTAIGPATDVYALGVILFELLTGKPPYSGPLMSMLTQIASAPVPAPRDLRPELDERLSQLCRKAMAKSPADRFSSMKELAEALRQCQMEAATLSPGVHSAALPPAGLPTVSGPPETIAAADSLPPNLDQAAIAAAVPKAPTGVPAAGETAAVASAAQPTLAVEQTPPAAPAAPGSVPAARSTPGKGRRPVSRSGPAAAAPASQPPATQPPAQQRISPAQLLRGMRRKLLAAGQFMVADSTRMALTISGGGVLMFLLLICAISLSRSLRHSESRRSTESAAGAAEVVTTVTDGASDTPPAEDSAGSGITTADTSAPVMVPNPIDGAGPASQADTPQNAPQGTTPDIVPLTESAEPAGEFVDMFNVDYLMGGWVAIGNTVWSRQNDILSSSSGVSILLSDLEYGDFELQLEYRMSAGTDSGVFVRIPRDTNGLDRNGSTLLEVQLLDDTHPNNRSSAYASGSVRGLFPQINRPTITLGDWNSLRVLLLDSQITVLINGTLTANGRVVSSASVPSAVPGLTNAAGRIGLQRQFGGSVEFRNMRIRPLRAATVGAATVGAATVGATSGNAATASPVAGSAATTGTLSTTAVAPTTAARADGWKPLWNGRDLTGWTIVKGTPGNWTIRDSPDRPGTSELVAATLLPDQESWLLTDNRYQDFTVRFWYRLRPDAETSGGLGFHLSLSDFKHMPLKLMDDNDLSDWANQRNERTGALWALTSAGPVTIIPPRKPARLQSGSQPGEGWNLAELSVIDENLQLTINGGLVQSLNLTSESKRQGGIPWLNRRSGHFGLQIRNGSIQFRDMEIQIPPARPPAVSVPATSDADTPAPTTRTAATAAPESPGIPNDARVFQGKSYKVYTEVLSWRQAETRSQWQGGQLAIADSYATNQFLTGLLRDSGLQEAWLGASRAAAARHWTWTDHSRLNYTDWAPGCPSDNRSSSGFLMLWLGDQKQYAGNGKWRDAPNVADGYRPGYICEWTAP